MIFGTPLPKVSVEMTQEILEAGKREGEEFFFVCAARGDSQLLAMSNFRIAIISAKAKRIFLHWDLSTITELFIDSKRVVIFGSFNPHTFKIHNVDSEPLRKFCTQLRINLTDKKEELSEVRKERNEVRKERLATIEASRTLLAEIPGSGFTSQGIKLFTDSIQIEGRFRTIDVHTVAEVVSNGQVQVTTRPTLTRMALLSPIPGSALLPGLALAKSKTNDLRVSEIIVTSLNWQDTARIKPEDASKATAIANRINTIANSLVGVEAAPTTTVIQKSTVVNEKDTLSSELSRLGDLLKSGLLSEEEFKTAKAKILGS